MPIQSSRHLEVVKMGRHEQELRRVDRLLQLCRDGRATELEAFYQIAGALTADNVQLVMERLPEHYISKYRKWMATISDPNVEMVGELPPGVEEEIKKWLAEH